METGCDLDARIGNFLRIERPKPIVPPAALMRWSANNPWEKFAEPSQELLHQNPPEPVAQKQSHKQPFKEIFPKRAKLNPSSSTRLVSVCKSPPRIGCPEPCAVCGAASTGYHYEVPSCNGCKTFFRRTVLAQRTFDCKKDGKCFSVLPKERRCICRACRFSKCVAVGMNPLAIISGQAPEDNILMQAIIKENIQTERLADQAVPMKCLASADDPVANLLERLMYLEVKHESIRRSTYNPRINPVTRLRDLLASPSELGKSYQEMPGWPISKECVKGTMPLPIEVYVRKRIPIPTSPGRDIPFNVKQWFFCDMVYSVEYVKTFDFFNELSSEDQLALLKNSVLQCVNLTSSFFSFQQRSDMIIWPDGRLKAESERENDRRNIIPTMIRLNLDRAEYVLLKAFVLCNPAWENLSEEARSLLIPARENYARSLLSYCLKKEGITRGPARFTAILAVFDLLCNQAQRVKELNVLLCALNLRPRKVPLFDDICQ